MQKVWILLLEKFAKLIEEANSSEEKQTLVIKKINIESIEQIAQDADINEELQKLLESNQLYTTPRSWSETTTAVALAICLADVKKVKLFLNYIPDINDSRHFVWGYKQLYSYVHLVGCPWVHIASLSFRDQEIDVVLNTRREILQALALKGADFNWTVGHRQFDYQNPPLATCLNPGGGYNGFTDMNKYNAIFSELMKLFVIYGANPAISGSSFSLSFQYNILPLIKHVAKRFINNELSFNKSYLRLDPEIKACFSEVINENITCPRSQFKTLLMCYNRQQTNGDNSVFLPTDLAQLTFEHTLDLAKLKIELLVKEPKIEDNIKILCRKYKIPVA